MAQETTDFAPVEQPGDSNSRQSSGCWHLILVWLGLNILFVAGGAVLAISYVGSEIYWVPIITAVVTAGVLLAVAVGVWKRQKWARIAVVVLMGLNILSAAIRLLSGDDVSGSISAIPSVLGVYWILKHPEEY